jgi:hypothetical protein
MVWVLGGGIRREDMPWIRPLEPAWGFVNIGFLLERVGSFFVVFVLPV